MDAFKYTYFDFLYTCVGLSFLLLDIGLDIWAAVSFYQEKAYACLGILALFLIGSSVLVQAFSWLWYSYQKEEEDEQDRQSKVEKCLTHSQLKLLHVLQLGIYFRHAGVVEMSIRSFNTHNGDSESYAAFMNHDLCMLRLIETFSESSPQFVLMLAVILQQGGLDPVTALKAFGSALAIAFSVTTYHRSLRSFLPDKKKQQTVSSLVYFLWNLFLISSRLTALALFASVLPCFIFTHFLCSWLVFFFFAWQSKTDFMESPCGEWLYRATAALIWYFNWFNVAEGKTRYRTLLYHGFILLDISLLCSLWYWKMSTEKAYSEIPHLNTIITVSVVVAVYIVGLLIKVIYYKHYHPNLAKEELKSDTTGLSGDETDFSHPIVMGRCMDTDVTDRSGPSPPAPDVKHCNKRMRKLAANFYS